MTSLYLGDCMERLKELSANSIDSVVTDPPYGISFMSKKWDYNVPSAEVFAEIMRVLKPGGHMLCACGTRTQHRMAVNIEDAGFEIRDVITWLYGSGFPKSLDISKAIDKAAGVIRERVPIVDISTGKNKSADINGGVFNSSKEFTTYSSEAITEEAKQWQGFGTALKPATEHMTLARKNGINLKVFNEISEILCHYLSHALTATTNSKSSQRESKEALSTAQWIAEESISTLDALSGQMDMLQLKLTEATCSNIVALWRNILTEVSQHMNMFTTSMATSLTIDLKILKSYLFQIMQRNTLHQETTVNGQGFNAYTVESFLKNVKIKLSFILNTDAQCDVLHDMDSLGDRLSPNSKFFTLARKPLSEKTVAKNVLKYGTGVINIDGCRVESIPPSKPQSDFKSCSGVTMSGLDASKRNGQMSQASGRFPANLILDEEAAMALDEQSGVLKSGAIKEGQKLRESSNVCMSGKNYERVLAAREPSQGGASRFFYVAKASKSERNAGLEHLAKVKLGVGDERPSSQSMQRLDGREAREMQNHHPTVKPIKLMTYLCRLITPPGGTVLDPFMGSGSTGVAALKEGFKFIGIERQEEYFNIAKARIEAVGF